MCYMPGMRISLRCCTAKCNTDKAFSKTKQQCTINDKGQDAYQHVAAVTDQPQTNFNSKQLLKSLSCSSWWDIKIVHSTQVNTQAKIQTLLSALKAASVATC